MSPQHGQASLRPPTRLSNSALTPPPNGEACALATATACVGWIVRRFAAPPRAPLARAHHGSRGACRRSAFSSAPGWAARRPLRVCNARVPCAVRSILRR